MGSVKLVYPPDTPLLIDLYWRKFRVDWRKIIEELIGSGIVLFHGSIVPAPYLEFNFMNNYL